jgi:TDG/mug DNA glycosylase family protein
VLHPSEQRALLRDGYGITNLVNRATATAEEVAAGEFVAGRKRLAAKVRKYRPRIVAFLGVGAYCHGFGLKAAAVGPQPGRFEGAKVWVLPNPSGLNANYQLPQLVKLFRALRMDATGHAFRNDRSRGKGTPRWRPSSTRRSSGKSKSTASRTC